MYMYIFMHTICIYILAAGFGDRVITSGPPWWIPACPWLILVSERMSDMHLHHSLVKMLLQVIKMRSNAFRVHDRSGSPTILSVVPPDTKHISLCISLYLSVSLFH